MVEASARAHRARATACSTPSPRCSRSARWRGPRTIDEARAAGRAARAARRRAVRGQEPVRHCGPADACRLEDQPAPPARRARRDADRAARSRRRGPRRRTQHGRIRLRLHRRERARRPLAQSARSRAHDRRLLRRLGRRGRGRARAARARVRHQRIDPRAGLVLRHLRAQADLRPARRARTAFRSSRASIMSGRSRARRATSRSPTTPCRATTPTIRSAPSGRSSRPSPLLDRGTDGLRIAVAGGYFRAGAFPEATAALERVAGGARRASDEIDIPEAERARAAAYVITATEGAALHLDRLRRQARDFDPGRARPADRRRHGAGGAGRTRRRNSGAGTARRCSICSSTSTPSWRRRRPAPRPRSASRPSCSTASRCRCGPMSASTPSRSRSSDCRWSRCRCRSSRCRSRVQIIAAPWREDIALRIAHALEQARASPPPGRHEPAPAKTIAESKGAEREKMEIDRPDVVAEVTAAFERYEQALVTNDVAALDAIFRADPRTIRYGVAEILYGHDEIAAFRAARSPVGLARTHRRRPSSPPTAAISRWPRRCSTAPPCPARSGARCRPGCASRTAGTSSPPMSADRRAAQREGAPAAEARKCRARRSTASASTRKPFTPRPSARRERADRQRRRHGGDEAAEILRRHRPDFDLDRGAAAGGDAQQPGLRRIGAGEREQPIVGRRPCRLQQAARRAP